MKFETRHKSSLVMGIVCVVLGVLGLIPSGIAVVMVASAGSAGGSAAEAAPCLLTCLCPMAFFPLALAGLWYTIFPVRVVVEKGALVLYRSGRKAGFIPLDNIEDVRVHWVEEAAPEGLWSVLGVIGSIIAAVVQEKVQRAAGFVIRVRKRNDPDTWWGNPDEELAEKKIVLEGLWDREPEKIVRELREIIDDYQR